MRSTLFIPVLLSLALPASAGAIGAPVAPDPADNVKPPLQAKLSACETGPEVTARAAEFSASMPALTNTRRMQMRFTLQQRLGTTGKFKRITVPGWGDWERSDPGRIGFVFTKRVESLAAPAAYKATVTFRWYDKRGRQQRSATRTTGACTEPDPRPDLVLSDLTASRGTNDQVFYTVIVRNAGLTAASPFGATLSVGSSNAAVTFDTLAAGAMSQATVIGPPCEPGSTVTVRLDPDDAVDEAVESDDTVRRTCPL